MAGVPERKKGRNLVVFSVIALLVIAALVFLFVRAERPVEQSLGVTFSSVYARYLGIDTRETFSALLDEVGVRQFRIPVYWSEIEPVDDAYDFEDLDWMMSEAAARGARVTLAIGVKVPRWPECFIPDWAETGAYPFDREQLDEFLTTVVERYRQSPALTRWQVENEAYFHFGVCPEPDPERVADEIALVRSLDDQHPIMMTASGELEAWLPVAASADVLGISLYRKSWNRVLGYVQYPVPSWFYRLRTFLVRPFVDTVMISELQAEPWLPDGVHSRPAAEWYPFFTAENLRDNVEFAARTGIPEVDLWGAEWWYHLKKAGEPRLWNEAKNIFYGHNL